MEYGEITTRIWGPPASAISHASSLFYCKATVPAFRKPFKHAPFANEHFGYQLEALLMVP